jgi:hypothetical protein
MEYDKVFAVISAHFLTESLPSNWSDFEDEELEIWFTKYALDRYEYWDWQSVYSEIAEITDTVMELNNAA